ncbi:VOC family protein [Nocardia altamirensis]|uniref:VOC family protein n=1 Tax=Nocardia altamirensis TaxID=472158 RepID=UPI0008400155|nr:VOC family protein [Nocardia altamirensis]
MAMQLVQVNMKALDEVALGRFWAAALGWRSSSEGPGVINLEPEGFTWPDPAAVCVDIVVSPEPKTARNRVRLELSTTSVAHHAELVARLEGLGATPVDIGQTADRDGEAEQPGNGARDVPSRMLADPEGNEFSVQQPLEIYRDIGPIGAVVVDCADPQTMARFWSAAVDWTVHEATDDHALLRSAKDVGPYLRFVRTLEPKVVWNRVHLDVAPFRGNDRAPGMDRLRTLGATDIDLGDTEVAWSVMADPEGNEFCVLGRS